ncbi:hypothetical protein [Reichenbachiella versicolor]|uniref:hypothetical protein n=1 Tax=Reichenbachiella versicolor TaxID=1821036 RepID=UPI0013A530B3|nr:hypothetical protein [Reichenbachiella versicolor]
MRLATMRLCKSIIVFLFLNSFLSLHGQDVDKRQLFGEWKANNQDSTYYKNDTITLFLDVNHKFQTNTCKLVQWRIGKKSFKKVNSFICTEPGRLNSSVRNEKLKLKNTDFGQTIVLSRQGVIFDKFKILQFKEQSVNRYPYEIKQLTVLRFDELSQNKLFNYVDSILFNVLGYEPSELDSTVYKPNLGTAVKKPKVLKIRDRQEQDLKPILIINGHIVENYEMLKEFLFVEAIDVQYLTKEDMGATSICGGRALNGVISMVLSKKKFKKVFRDFN